MTTKEKKNQNIATFVQIYNAKFRWGNIEKKVLFIFQYPSNLILSNHEKGLLTELKHIIIHN